MKPKERLQEIEKERSRLADKIGKCGMIAKSVRMKTELSKLNNESQKIRKAFPKVAKEVEFETYNGLGFRIYPNIHNS